MVTVGEILDLFVVDGVVEIQRNTVIARVSTIEAADGESVVFAVGAGGAPGGGSVRGGIDFGALGERGGWAGRAGERSKAGVFHGLSKVV